MALDLSDSVARILAKYGEKTVYQKKRTQAKTGDKPWKPSASVSTVVAQYKNIYIVYWTKQTRFMELVGLMKGTEVAEGETYALLAGTAPFTPGIGDVIVSPSLGELEIVGNDPIAPAGKVQLHVLRVGR